MWIRIERQITKSEIRVRFLSVPIQIMEGYTQKLTDDKIFKMNYLAAICRNIILLLKLQY